MQELIQPVQALSDLFTRGRVVKIDGLREPEHAAAAAMAGADLIGFIFAPARRQVSAATARECIAAAGEAARGRQVLSVGVFVDEDPERIMEAVRQAGLDAVQLHGEEPPEVLAALPVPAIKAFRPRQGTSISELASAIQPYLSGERCAVAALIDGYAEGSSGGSGTRADWDLAADICGMRPVLLGGGLDAGNVGEAIRHVRPLGVDVSSGVETDGRKDPLKIAAFVAAAREAFAR